MQRSHQLMRPFFFSRSVAQSDDHCVRDTEMRASNHLAPTYLAYLA